MFASERFGMGPLRRADRRPRPRRPSAERPPPPRVPRARSTRPACGPSPDAPTAPMLVARGLGPRYRGVRRARRRRRATSYAGESVALIGPNGAGKTTLLDDPRRGHPRPTAAAWRGPTARAARRLGAAAPVPLPAPDAAREPAPLRRARGRRRRRTPSPAELIERADLGAFADRPPAKLSTGTIQRLNLAIALAGPTRACCCSTSRRPPSARTSATASGSGSTRCARTAWRCSSPPSRSTRRCAAGDRMLVLAGGAAAVRRARPQEMVRAHGIGARRRRRGGRAGVHAPGRAGGGGGGVRSARPPAAQGPAPARAHARACCSSWWSSRCWWRLLVALALQSDERRPDVAVVNLDTSGRTVAVGESRLVDRRLRRPPLRGRRRAPPRRGDRGRGALDAGRVSAVLTIPDGFISDLQSGVRQPALLLDTSRRSPIEADAIVRNLRVGRLPAQPAARRRLRRPGAAARGPGGRTAGELGLLRPHAATRSAWRAAGRWSTGVQERLRARRPARGGRRARPADQLHRRDPAQPRPRQAGRQRDPGARSSSR